MTISADYGPLIDSGNGTTKDFAVTFPFDEKGDLLVTLFDTVANDNVLPPPVLNGVGPNDYTVTGTTDPNTGIYPSGTITFNTAPQGGWNIVRQRKTPQLQPLSLIDNARFPAKSVEGEFDRLELQIQEIDNVASRAIVAPASDGPIDLTLPPKDDRAGMLLGFDAAGSPEIPLASAEVAAAVAAFLAGVAPASATAGWAATLAAAKVLYPASVALANGQAMVVSGRLAVDDDYGGVFVYRAGDTTTSFPQDGLGFVDAAGRRWFRLYTGSISLMWFGAKGDGVADDTAALQAWLTALGSGYFSTAILGPRIGFAPAGIYNYTVNLTVPASSTIRGVRLCTVFRPQAGVTKALICENGVAVEDIVVHGIAAGANKIGVSIGDEGTLVSSIILRGVMVVEFAGASAYGLKLGECAICKFEDCDFSDNGNGARMVTVVTAPTNIVFDFCRFKSNDYRGLYATAGDNVVFQGACDFELNGTDGFYLDGSGGLDAIVNWTFVGPYFEGNQQNLALGAARHAAYHFTMKAVRALRIEDFHIYTAASQAKPFELDGCSGLIANPTITNGVAGDISVKNGSTANVVTFTNLTNNFGSPDDKITYDNDTTRKNTIFDFELQSTFTPDLTFATPGGLTKTGVTAVGREYRRGRHVRIEIVYQATITLAGTTGGLRLTGMSYTCRTVTDYTVVGSLVYQGITKAGYTQIVPFVGSGTNFIGFYASGSGQPVSLVTSSDTPTGGQVLLDVAIEFEVATA